MLTLYTLEQAHLETVRPQDCRFHLQQCSIFVDMDSFEVD